MHLLDLQLQAQNYGQIMGFNYFVIDQLYCTALLQLCCLNLGTDFLQCARSQDFKLIYPLQLRQEYLLLMVAHFAQRSLINCRICLPSWVAKAFLNHLVLVPLCLTIFPSNYLSLFTFYCKQQEWSLPSTHCLDICLLK